MIVIKGNDFFDIRVKSLIADYDRDTVANLYQPIIGYVAHALYMSLIGETSFHRKNNVMTHDDLFIKMGIDAKRFVDARKMLEAVGLLKSYLDTSDSGRLFIYELYAPKTPKAFFDNTLLFGMLIKCYGEDKAMNLKRAYSGIGEDIKGEDISSNFIDVFAPDYNETCFKKAVNTDSNITSRNIAHVAYAFSYEKFFARLKEISSIGQNNLSSKEMKEVERIATLYGVDEENAANGLASIYDSEKIKGSRIDFEKLVDVYKDTKQYEFIVRKSNGGSKISSDSDLANKINLLEEKSPKEYLCLLQNNNFVISSDLRLLESLSKNFNLPNPVINVIIDYVLTMNNNVLSKGYAEKVASSIAREGITSAYDAMVYFKRINNKKTEKKVTEVTKPVKTKPKEEIPNSEKSNIDWDKLINDLDDEGGEENGKA